MKKKMRDIDDKAVLYSDDRTGVAWIEKEGEVLTPHAYISDAGSVRQMKKLGYWAKDAKTITIGGYIFNISTYLPARISDPKNYPYRKIVMDVCMCEECNKKRV